MILVPWLNYIYQRVGFNAEGGSWAFAGVLDKNERLRRSVPDWPTSSPSPVSSPPGEDSRLV